MSKQNNTTPRKQLSKIAGVETSHARVRSILSDQYINREPAEHIRELKEQVEQIKKTGAPAYPDNKPVNPGKNATDAEKSAYEKAKTAYDAKVTAYNKFVSDEYSELKVAHAAVKHLMKMREFLDQPKLSASSVKELTKLQEGFTNINKYKNETDSVFSKREKFHEKVMNIVSDVDTANAASVGKAADALTKTYPNLAILLEKDGWSRKSLRINDGATIAMAAVIDEFIAQLAEHSMDNTLKNKKAIITPDNCVSDDVENISLFPLVAKLPHFIAVEEKQHRKEEWAAAKKLADDEAAKKARAAAKRKEEEYKRPASKFITFEKQEVKNGYALKVEDEVENNKGETVKKVKYLWYDIDIERDDSSYDNFDEDDEDHEHEDTAPNFTFYARSICKNVKQAKLDEGYEDHYPIRVGVGITRLFSNLAIDFIARMAPLIVELIKFKGSSTITDEVIKVALRILLIDNRPDVDGTSELSDEHEDLINIIDSKVHLINAHQTKSKAAAAASDEGPADDDVDDDLDEVIEPAPKPQSASRRRRPVARK